MEHYEEGIRRPRLAACSVQPGRDYPPPHPRPRPRDRPVWPPVLVRWQLPLSVVKLLLPQSSPAAAAVMVKDGRQPTSAAVSLPLLLPAYLCYRRSRQPMSSASSTASRCSASPSATRTGGVLGAATRLRIAIWRTLTPSGETTGTFCLGPG